MREMGRVWFTVANMDFDMRTFPDGRIMLVIDDEFGKFISETITPDEACTIASKMLQAAAMARDEVGPPAQASGP